MLLLLTALAVQILAAHRLERCSDLKVDLKSRFSVSVAIVGVVGSDEAFYDVFFAKMTADLCDNVGAMVNNAGISGMPGPIYIFAPLLGILSGSKSLRRPFIAVRGRNWLRVSTISSGLHPVRICDCSAW